MLTLYSAALVFPVDAPPLPEGAVVTEGERILAVGTTSALADAYPNARHVALGAAALLPGAVNAHTHLELTGLAGALPEGAYEFAEWVVALMAQRHAQSAEDLARAARDGVAMLLASGTAAVGEISTYGLAVEPLIASGLDGIIYYEVLHGDPAQADAALDRGKRQLAEWHERYPGVRMRFGLSLHAPYTVSSPLFTRASALCADEGIPLCIHTAESPAEVQWLRERTGPIADVIYTPRRLPTDLEPPAGCSPVAHLARLGVLDAHPLLVHGVQVDAADLATLARAEVAVAHCPHSNAWLRCGRLPWAAYRRAGVPLALGTDSLASAPSLSVWEEAAYARETHTLAGEPPAPTDLLRLVTLDGARALGLADELGSLTTGKRAALAMVPLDALPASERADPERVLTGLFAGQLAARALRG